MGMLAAKLRTVSGMPTPPGMQQADPNTAREIGALGERARVMSSTLLIPHSRATRRVLHLNIRISRLKRFRTGRKISTMVTMDGRRAHMSARGKATLYSAEKTIFQKRATSTTKARRYTAD